MPSDTIGGTGFVCPSRRFTTTPHTMTEITLLSEITDSVGPMVPVLDNVPADELPTLQAEFRELSRVFLALAHYCDSTKAARDFRVAGRVSTAQALDQHADEIYRSLPDWARW